MGWTLRITLGVVLSRELVLVLYKAKVHGLILKDLVTGTARRRRMMVIQSGGRSLSLVTAVDLARLLTHEGVMHATEDLLLRCVFQLPQVHKAPSNGASSGLPLMV